MSLCIYIDKSINCSFMILYELRQSIVLFVLLVISYTCVYSILPESCKIFHIFLCCKYVTDTVRYLTNIVIFVTNIVLCVTNIFLHVAKENISLFKVIILNTK